MYLYSFFLQHILDIIANKNQPAAGNSNSLYRRFTHDVKCNMYLLLAPTTLAPLTLAPTTCTISILSSWLLLLNA